MTLGRTIGIALLAVVLALGGGYVWGSSGRFAATNELQTANQQLDLAVARGHLLDARVSLYSVNFGSASQSLEAAKAPIARAGARYRATGNRAAADTLETATALIGEAQALSAKLDQSANTKTAAAIDTVSAALAR